ncbi:MAG: hypothetical protein HYZ68_01740, partial [Chloroflexi bacterium]|nr:hypothetical protein [Chloroflexota bacterium]
MKWRILLVALILALAAAQPAAADAPDNPNCWGVVTAQRAVAVGGIGEHASSFAGEPRLGLGNVARLLFDLSLTAGPHVSDLGSLLA